MAKILVETKDKIATILINNPDKMNCLDMEMLSLLEGIFIDLKERKNASVLIIKGAGDQAFSTGGNLKAFEKLSKFHEVKNWIKYGNDVFNLLETLPIATIAAIEGYTIGGGLELALSCDLRISSEKSVFYMPELNHGWVPGWGGLSRLRRLIGEAKAKEMIMLGERMTSHEAFQFGLINRVCKENSVTKTVDEVALKLSKIDSFVLEMSKTAIMDHHRSTTNNNLLYDVLATYYSKL